jgi:S-formylglutathione hydrolase FrmB
MSRIRAAQFSLATIELATIELATVGLAMAELSTADTICDTVRPGRSRMMRARIRVVATAALAAVCAMLPGLAGPPASAVPAPRLVDPIVATRNLLGYTTAPDGSKIDSASLLLDNRTIELRVYSAAMKQDIVVCVQRPYDASRPRPTLYLLNGAGGGQDTATWVRNTDALKFLADKNVNVVLPIGGAWSYYTDWRAVDPRLGVNKWKTFFTKELPPLINTAMGTNRVNAIAGVSTSGTSVLQLPEAAPGLYQAVGAYSGCAQISDPTGYRFVNLAVETWGGGDTMNMYGPENDPMWAANDPYLHADRLRGLALFISSGNGVPGPYDVLNGPHALPGSGGLANQIVLGGIIESAVNYCSHNLQAKLNALGIPATYDFTPYGTHSWGYWQDDLIRSWPVLAKGLGLPA